MEEVGNPACLLPDDENIPEAYDTVPSNDIFTGPFNFDVHIPPSKNLVYSPKLEKLFIKMFNDFTVRFAYDRAQPCRGPLYVRARPRFSGHEDANKPVKRCLQHAHKEDPSNRDPAIRHHVMRCGNSRASYEGGAAHHFSVVVPLAVPEAGTESVPLAYQFVCQNSCPTGMNRRPIEVIFTLEDERGEILGRRSISARICSCPKRDKEKEEDEAGDSPAQPSAGKRRKRALPMAQGNANDENDNTVHSVTINVLGIRNKKALLQGAFNILCGDMVSRPGHEHQYKPLLDDIQNTLNNL